ncbi:MAG: hypothetical protein EAZ53_03185 [Bacteroidetes bacterium]|nr:MAG: hypothetical protein EAZ53_03185 [Bacteroidota bacterium]
MKKSLKKPSSIFIFVGIVLFSCTKDKKNVVPNNKNHTNIAPSADVIKGLDLQKYISKELPKNIIEFNSNYRQSELSYESISIDILQDSIGGTFKQNYEDYKKKVNYSEIDLIVNQIIDNNIESKNMRTQEMVSEFDTLLKKNGAQEDFIKLHDKLQIVIDGVSNLFSLESMDSVSISNYKIKLRNAIDNYRLEVNQNTNISIEEKNVLIDASEYAFSTTGDLLIKNYEMSLSGSQNQRIQAAQFLKGFSKAIGTAVGAFVNGGRTAIALGGFLSGVKTGIGPGGLAVMVSTVILDRVFWAGYCNSQSSACKGGCNLSSPSFYVTFALCVG